MPAMALEAQKTESHGSPRQLAIEVFRIRKTFDLGGKLLTVFDEFSMEVQRGEVLSVLGASGCGKTTLLNIISGTEKYDSGKVRVAPESRVGYMFQFDLLLPWRDAERNALLGLEVIGNDHVNINRQSVSKYFDVLGLKGFERYYPHQLSGGMRQRVALIRTLAYDPDILLLDEPFSSLDYSSKLSLETAVLRFARERERTVVFVTHDIDEAIAVGSKLVVLEGEPLENRPSRVVWSTNVRFDADVMGRNPIAARQDRKFPEYFAGVCKALGKT
jgi:NitT/TauT family transport system ATP-binding protein